MPSIYFTNARSMCNKMDELFGVSATLKPHVIAVAESWLNDSVSAEQVRIPEFQAPFRCDRRNGRSGGGVCCFVRSDIACEHIVLA